MAGFVKDRIDVDHVVRDKTAPSGVALIFVARDGENSIAVASGANARLSPADVKKAASDRLGRRRRDAARNASGHGASRGRDRGEGRRARDPQSRACPAVARRSARLVSILTPNETEAELLTGSRSTDQASAAQAADRLLARGVQTVIITLG